MLFKGTIQTCVDFLARYDTSFWTDIFVLIHVPRWRCYAVMTDLQFHEGTHEALSGCHRVVFRGSILEAAHFVLCPPMSLHETRNTLPDLEDNIPPSVTAGGPETAKLDAADVGAVAPPNQPPRAGQGNNGDHS